MTAERKARSSSDQTAAEDSLSFEVFAIPSTCSRIQIGSAPTLHKTVILLHTENVA